MSDIDILHQMVRDTAKIPVSDEYSRKKVVLKEPQQPKSLVTILGLPDDVIVIKADAFRSPDTVFKGTQGECKRADFVIVADTGDKKVIICIEMKAKKKQRWTIVKQLTGAKCFVLYCQGIGREFWNKPDFLIGYEYRFVAICHTSIAKRKTRYEKKLRVLHDHPENMLRISRPNDLQFNRLAGA